MERQQKIDKPMTLRKIKSAVLKEKFSYEIMFQMKGPIKLLEPRKQIDFFCWFCIKGSWNDTYDGLSYLKTITDPELAAYALEKMEQETLPEAKKNSSRTPVNSVMQTVAMLRCVARGDSCYCAEPDACMGRWGSHITMEGEECIKTSLAHVYTTIFTGICEHCGTRWKIVENTDWDTRPPGSWEKIS